jgi:hypothetical protein
MSRRLSALHGVFGALSSALVVVATVTLSLQLLATSSLVTIVTCVVPSGYTGWSGVHIATQGQACRESLSAMATEGETLASTPIILIAASHIVAVNVLGALWAEGLTTQLAQFMRRVRCLVVRRGRHPSIARTPASGARRTTPVVVEHVVAVLATSSRRHPRRGPPTSSPANAARPPLRRGFLQPTVTATPA